MAIIFGIVYALPWFIVYFGTWELPYEIRKRESSALAVFSQFAAIWKNRSFRTQVGMYITAYTASDILMALFVYFLTYYLKKPNLYAVAMGSLMVVQILMMSVYTMISNRRGKGFAYVLGLSLYAVGLLTAFFALNPDSSTLTVALSCALIGTGTSAAALIPWAILPSVIDIDQLITGKKRSGVYSGAMTLIRKMVQGLIAMPLIGFILTRIGFVSNQAQSLATQQGLRYFFLLGPLVMILLGILIGLRFRITPERHQVVVKEIRRLEEGGPRESVSSETKEVCELLTGLPYEELYWGQ